MLIAVEGCDRVGKTSAIKVVCGYLATTGRRCVVFRFPDRTTETGLAIDRELREPGGMPAAELAELFQANRAEKQGAIESALARGDYVVCDRYVYSGAAYAGADVLQGTDRAMPQPAMVLYLAVDPEVAAGRPGFGSEGPEKVEVQREVARRFDALLAAAPRSVRVARVDASGPVAEVRAAVWAALEAGLKTGALP